MTFPETVAKILAVDDEPDFELLLTQRFRRQIREGEFTFRFARDGEEALNLAYHGARAQDANFNITLERDFDPDLAPIELAPQEMTRVLLNLIGNGFYAATKRPHEGAAAGFRPALKVTTRELGEAVEIRVCDNGAGIPPEIKDKLFQPFFTTKPPAWRASHAGHRRRDWPGPLDQLGHRYPAARRHDRGRQPRGRVHRVHDPPAAHPPRDHAGGRGMTASARLVLALDIALQNRQTLREDYRSRSRWK